MRIISGCARGRKLFGPGSEKGSRNPIRPTSDRVRESLFNILGPKAAADTVLDLFAGTGALGIEALSRGAASGVFVDNSRRAVELIKRNLDTCGFTENSTVFHRDILRGIGFLKNSRPPEGYELVFCDPPYHMGRSLELLRELQERNLIAPGGLVVIEDGNVVELPEQVENCRLIDSRRYGDSSLWIYRNT